MWWYRVVKVAMYILGAKMRDKQEGKIIFAWLMEQTKQEDKIKLTYMMY